MSSEKDIFSMTGIFDCSDIDLKWGTRKRQVFFKFDLQ